MIDMNINKKLAIVIIATCAALVLSLVGMTVSLIVDNINDNSGYVVDGGGDGGGRSKAPQSTQASVDVKPGAKTGIVLPCATKDGTYLSVSNESTQDVSGDSEIQSAATVLVDITDNVTVAGKNADTKIYPASMTKVMTLLVACENAKDPNARMTLDKAMIDKYNKSENVGASLAFEWQEGYQITVEDALHMIIYGSDTYACWLIADYVAGGEEAFVAMMNKKAADMGLKGTSFTNCTGLYNTNHYTTCREMAAIMAAAMNNETATAVLGRKEMYTVDIYKNGESSDESSAWSAWYTGRLEEYQYSGTNPKYAGKGSDIEIVGGKTGYETIPKCCFVTAGVNDITGRRYVCVQVGRIDESQPTVDEETSTFDTREMYWKYAKEKND